MGKYKYGLLSYGTENIGDEVQSIAARRFLPSIDYYFDRDNIDKTKLDPKEKVKVIMNSWYMAKPYNWPPKNQQIKPLLISMYVERNNPFNRTDKKFLSKRSKEYIAKHGGVGARDKGTQKFFKDNGVKSYFSGCLTLTLIPDEYVKKQDFILAVDVSSAVLEKIAKNTDRRIVQLNTERTCALSTDEKMRMAEYWLSIYQSAHCVVTTRLHTMLPCLSLGTPVYAIRKKDLKRYGGLIELTNNYSEDEFINADIDFEHPLANPEKFRTIRSRLEKKCSKFTGYDSKSSYLNGKRIDDLYVDPDLMSAISKNGEKAYRLSVDSENQLNEIKRLEGVIEDIQSNNNDAAKDVALGIRASARALQCALIRRVKLLFKR